MADSSNDNNDEGLSDTAKAYRSVAPYLAATWRMVGGCVVGVLGGWAVDHFGHTKPWGVIVGSFIGIAVGFAGLMASITALDKQKKAK